MSCRTYFAEPVSSCVVCRLSCGMTGLRYVYRLQLSKKPSLCSLTYIANAPTTIQCPALRVAASLVLWPPVLVCSASLFVV